MIQFLEQNLLDAKVDVIIQSNNCCCKQGRGIALSISEKYGEVYNADFNTISGDKTKLGKILPVRLHQKNQPYYCFLNFNQFNYGLEKRQVDYEAFYTCLEKSRDKCLSLGLESIGMPFGMSCNNAGGDWEIILAMVRKIFSDSKVNLFICKYSS